MSGLSKHVRHLKTELERGEFGAFLKEYMDQKKFELFLENTSTVFERLQKIKKRDLDR